MAKLKHSKELEKKLEWAAGILEGDASLHDLADSSCVTDYETQAFDIFENGFDLAVHAQGRPVLYGTVDKTTYFFVVSSDEAGVLSSIDEEVRAWLKERG